VRLGEVSIAQVSLRSLPDRGPDVDRDIVDELLASYSRIALGFEGVFGGNVCSFTIRANGTSKSTSTSIGESPVRVNI
jgi:hypothetical protein